MGSVRLHQGEPLGHAFLAEEQLRVSDRRSAEGGTGGHRTSVARRGRRFVR